MSTSAFCPANKARFTVSFALVAVDRKEEEEALKQADCWPLQPNTLSIGPLHRLEALQSGHCLIWFTVLNLEKAVILTASDKNQRIPSSRWRPWVTFPCRPSQSCQLPSWEWPACQGKNNQEVLQIRSYRGLETPSAFDFIAKIFSLF